MEIIWPVIWSHNNTHPTWMYTCEGEGGGGGIEGGGGGGGLWI